MVILTNYNEPEKKDMAIVIAFFNPAKSIRLIQNFLTIKQCLERANIPTFIGELVTGDEPFLLKPSENVFQFRSDSYMFYKENIMTLIEKEIPSNYTKILQLDGDIMYENPDWYTLVSDTLDHYNVIQPWSKAIQLQFNFVAPKRDPLISCVNKKDGHQGYAWAFQRKWWKEANLFESAVIGGGDSMTAQQCGIIISAFLNSRFYSACFKDGVIPKKPCSYGSCAVTIYHLPHGSMKNRQYDDRYITMMKLLKQLKLNAITDAIQKREDGILVWKSEYKDILNATMLAYFKNRQDDQTSE